MVCFSFSLLARTALRRLQGYKKYVPDFIWSLTLLTRVLRFGPLGCIEYIYIYGIYKGSPLKGRY